jgi:hypothetical protein
MKREKIHGVELPKQPIRHQMKTKSIPFVAAAVLCSALAPAAFAQTVNGDQNNNTLLYLPNVSLTGLSQNSFSGIVGGIFYTPYYYNVSVNYLGYADPNDAPLAMSHTITLWGAGGNAVSGSVVASAVVPSGTPTLWANGYAWVQLGSTVTLSYQSYYDIGATVTGGVDSWGDLISNNSPDPGNNGQITWNVENGISSASAPNGPFVQAGSGWEFSRAGIYDGNTSDAGNPNPSFGQTSQSDSIYPAPNIGYNVVPAPEPASVSLVGGGLVAILLMRRRKS